MMFLALCHTIISERKEDEIVYNVFYFELKGIDYITPPLIGIFS